MAELTPSLEMMRLVAQNSRCDDTGHYLALYNAFLELKREDPKEFRKQWLAEERKLSAEEWDGSGKCPTCGREAESPVVVTEATRVLESWAGET